MSYFGDDTPEQNMLDWVRLVEDDNNLTTTQVIQILCKILEYYYAKYLIDKVGEQNYV